MQRIMVRTTNWVGDAVMTTPALGAIRETFPDAKITVVANPLVAQLFEFHPDCDEVIVYDRQGRHARSIGFLRFVAMLRGRKFDCAILFQNAIEAAIMAFLAGVPKRLGYITDSRRLLLNYPVPIGHQERALHHTDYYLHMLAQCGVTTGTKQQRLALRPDEVQWAVETLPQGRFVVVNPGAAYGSAKRWIPERFAAVADELASSYGMSIVLSGGPGEMEIGADIAKAMQSPHQNLIGKTSVRQMMAALASSSLMITNDSGPMHVAAAFNVPMVAIFGPTDHTTTSPWGTNSQIVRHPVECSPCMLRQCPIDHRCMERVTVEDVMSAAAGLLEDAR
ncbi:MAG: lipopolysaccharide heptosyltransferase II [Deltaproteobacteria bacterium]|nr:lipopolysaccharide heptosyltransferase II [Deltaproteobacteria bacterium]